jgi:hypothetical protein
MELDRKSRTIPSYMLNFWFTKGYLKLVEERNLLRNIKITFIHIEKEKKEIQSFNQKIRRFQTDKLLNVKTETTQVITQKHEFL